MAMAMVMTNNPIRYLFWVNNGAQGHSRRWFESIKNAGASSEGRFESDSPTYFYPLTHQ